jgi:hypothetical protein
MPSPVQRAPLFLRRPRLSLHSEFNESLRQPKHVLNGHTLIGSAGGAVGVFSAGTRGSP